MVDVFTPDFAVKKIKLVIVVGDSRGISCTARGNHNPFLKGDRFRLPVFGGPRKEWKKDLVKGMRSFYATQMSGVGQNREFGL